MNTVRIMQRQGGETERDKDRQVFYLIMLSIAKII